jgi:hypothetical protein
MIPSPPFDSERVKESHLTLGWVLVALSLDEIVYHTSDLVAHPKIEILTSRHVPH